MTMQELMTVMEGIAPKDLAEPWDNPGLLVGAPDREVRAVLLCVDATPAVLDQAAEMNADCIIAHHPLMFGGTKSIRSDRYEGALLTRLVREDLILYAAHTNLDKAPGGVEDSLASALDLQVDAKTDYVRAGQVQPQTAGDVLRTVRQRLNPQAVFYGDAGAAVTRAAVSCGSGSEFFREALSLGAQLFVTGEMKHHERIEAQGLGMQIIIAGHEESERVVLEPLRQRLLKVLPQQVRVETAC